MSETDDRKRHFGCAKEQYIRERRVADGAIDALDQAIEMKVQRDEWRNEARELARIVRGALAVCVMLEDGRIIIPHETVEQLQVAIVGYE